MLNRLEEHALESAFQAALQAKMIRPEDTAIVFHDLDLLRARVEMLRGAFPSRTHHTAAVKAMPVRRILEHLRDWGMGFEVASRGELELALRLGREPSRIVFDSPAKTWEEIEFALSLGVTLNADSLQELARIAELKAGRCSSTTSLIGLRINPQVGTGAIVTTAVAADYSKFGVPLEQGSEILEVFRAYPWLTGLHFHIGSQGMSVAHHWESAHRLRDLRERIHQAVGRPQITTVDLGGGLPVPYLSGDQEPDFQEYADSMRLAAPELFASGVTLITEFGRVLHANAGWIASRVEYTKTQPGFRTLVTHIGADLCLRECYDAIHWPHEWLVLDASGKRKQGPLETWQIAGPLCFAGDLPGRNVRLPEVQPGDYLVMRDAGAYTLSMWSRYNSRQVPRVLGYLQTPSGEYQWDILKERESVQDVVRFWE